MKNVLSLIACLFLAVPAAWAQETSYSKTDYVPGDVVIFDDPVENEKMGEFPLHWDLLGGEGCEIMGLNGVQIIKLSGWYTELIPFKKDGKLCMVSIKTGEVVQTKDLY